MRAAGTFLPLLLLTGAASGEIKVLPGVEKDGGNELVAIDRHVVYTFIISNTGDADATIKITPQRTIRQRPVPCPSCATAAWSLNGTPVAKLAGSSAPLPRRAEAQLTLEGDLPDLDAYEASALVDQVAGKDRAASTIARVKIVRRLPSLGPSPVAAIDGGRFLSDGNDAIAFRLTNGGDDVVALAKLPVARFREDEGGGKYAIALRNAPVTATCDPPGGDTPLSLMPGAFTECQLPVPGLQPGRYRAFISTGQDGLAPFQATADFSVRYDWWVAALWLLLGSLIGALFAFFQGSLQRRLLQEAQALELRESYANFRGTLADANQPETIRITTGQIDGLSATLDSLRHGASADFKDALASSATLLPYLRALATLEPAFHANETDDTTEAFNAVLQALAAVPPDAASIAPAIERLRESLAAGAITVRGFAPDPGFTARIARAVPDKVRAHILRATSTTLQLVFSVISLAFSITIGVGALWVPNASWGSFWDVVVAVMTGVAATAAGTISLQTLAQPFTARLKI